MTPVDALLLLTLILVSWTVGTLLGNVIAFALLVAIHTADALIGALVAWLFPVDVTGLHAALLRHDEVSRSAALLIEEIADAIPTDPERVARELCDGPRDPA